ncbi:MAG: M20 family metallopeptidase [Bacteroidetes bacterium]|nr:M20 family metallopeptidase [Bacteroidota bacterium]
MNYNEIKEIEHKIIEYRRHLHANPELSFKEYETQNYIIDVLSKLEIECKSIGNTGVIAHIGDVKKYSDRCIAFRTDIDALPILEDTGMLFCSKNKGIMHACGHDLHTAMLLGAAEILKKNIRKYQGCIKLIFQPAEEVFPGGAKKLIEAGCLENPTPKMIFAQHIDPDKEIGKFSASINKSMASTCEFKIIVKGKGTHASTPYKGIDPVLVASNIISFAQAFQIRNNNPAEPIVLSICAVNGGIANNIFPDKVEMLGTLRSFDEEQRNSLLEKFAEKVRLLCEVYDAKCEFQINLGYPPVINDINCFNLVQKSVIDLFGNNSFDVCSPKMWAEDFSYYGKEIPSCLFFTGTNPIGCKEIYPLHSNKLNPSEDALIMGTSVIVSIANNFYI